MAENKHNTSSSSSSDERTSLECFHSELDGIEKQTSLTDTHNFQGNEKYEGDQFY